MSMASREIGLALPILLLELPIMLWSIIPKVQKSSVAKKYRQATKRTDIRLWPRYIVAKFFAQDIKITHI